MSDNGVKDWIKRSKNKGHSENQIREQLQASGWPEDKISIFLPKKKQEQPKRVSRVSAEDVVFSPSLKKFWVSVMIVALIIIVGGGLYFLGSHYGFPWEETVSSNIDTNVNSGSSTSVAKSLAEQLAGQSTMGKFDNYDQLKTFLDEHASSASAGYYGLPTMARSFVEQETFGLDTAELSAPLGLGSSELKSTDYSATNIQVEGVDEADIVKTDGEYIYAVSKKKVFIIDAYPAGDSKILSTIVFESTPQNIYINGDYLIIYGREDNIYDKSFYESIRPSSSYTFLKVFDVKDKVNPEQVRDLEFEGSYSNSRMIGDYVYFITSHPTYYVDDDMPIPLIIEDDVVLSTEAGTPRCNCPDIYYINAPYQQYTYTTVSAINVTDNDQPLSSDIYLLSSSENIYVSQSNIYLVYTKYVSEYQLMLEVFKGVFLSRLSVKDQQRIQEIEAVQSYILSHEEKLGKVYYIYNKYIESLTSEEKEAFQEQMEQMMKEIYTDISKELEKTVMHKIAINEGELTYKGSGEVTGHVLNQFSMDEHDGYFRIATTKGRTWSQFGLEEGMESYSNVYVLDENLNVVGAVENLAEGEQIYSARFMQGRVYLVTFRQMDPLFAIDLQDPKNPKVLGELKIPGFSSYLHPYDETKLIGFGKQATDQGIVKGLKLSLFDVSDVSNLKEIDTFEMGDVGSDSVALDDHKAFLFSKDKNLLAIPVTLRTEEAPGTYQYKYTHGAMVFTITEDGFMFRERIDHSDGSDDDDSSSYYYGYQYYDTTVKRSLYIDDVLYTLSNKYLKMNGLEDLAEVKSVTLTPGEAGDDYTIIQ